jgi:hypothetical protein
MRSSGGIFLKSGLHLIDEESIFDPASTAIKGAT